MENIRERVCFKSSTRKKNERVIERYKDGGRLNCKLTKHFMRVTINDIKKHFKNLGYKISLKLHHKSLLIQYKDGPDPHRLNNLATYFFGYNTRVINEGCCIVILKKFIEIGHKEVKGICNRCGCQEHDACY